MFFRLKPEIYLITGTAKDVLCNVLTGDVISLDKDMSELLRRAESNLPIDKNENIEKLIEIGYGEEFVQPIYVDKLRYTNKFNKKRAWKSMPKIGSIILQLTTRCGSKCISTICKKSFCPMCINSNRSDDIDFEEWKKIIDKMAYFGPKTYILTGGNPTKYEKYNDIHSYLIEKKYDVFTHVTDIETARKLNDRKVFLSCFDKETYAMASHLENVIAVSEFGNTGKNSIKVNMSSAPLFKKESLLKKKGFAEIFSRMIYDSCLLGKVTILSDGSLVPCLGMKDKIVGNLCKDNAAAVMKKLYEDYWSVSVDERVGQKCTSCEYRFNCTSCAKMTDDMCLYNVSEGKWK